MVSQKSVSANPRKRASAKGKARPLTAVTKRPSNSWWDDDGRTANMKEIIKRVSEGNYSANTNHFRFANHPPGERWERLQSKAKRIEEKKAELEMRNFSNSNNRLPPTMLELRALSQEANIRLKALQNGIKSMKFKMDQMNSQRTTNKQIDFRQAEENYLGQRKATNLLLAKPNKSRGVLLLEQANAQNPHYLKPNFTAKNPLYRVRNFMSKN